ncbi:MAG TPA: glycosyltransferase family 4 protein, partial [Syntrophales bacterium]|nr:glycosyltransferase family 4 protein [Syntrophales bacterium]HOM08223.1 glycosyltransferase family 4 protein [Syntrophales bacterium]
TKVAFVGRLELRKGIDLLVKAAASLYGTYPDVAYHLVGRIDKDPFQFLEAKGGGEGVREKIRLTGPIPRQQVLDLLAKCDFAVFPSRYEPFGIVALEAMACGLPVIVSDRGGWREAVEDGETGFVCRAGDVDSLREAMERMILLSPEARREMGRRGRDRVARDYATPVVADRMIAIYEKLTGKGP